MADKELIDAATAVTNEIAIVMRRNGKKIPIRILTLLGMRLETAIINASEPDPRDQLIAELREMCCTLVGAMMQECKMDVNDPPPKQHRAMMDSAAALIVRSAPPAEQGAEVKA